MSQFAVAIERYLALLDEHPEDWRTLMKVGDLILKDGDPLRAVAYYTRAVDSFETQAAWLKAFALQTQIVSILDSQSGVAPAERSAARSRAAELEARARGTNA